jgi:hypothetical protein
MKVRGAAVELTARGDYRFDFEPPQLSIYRGAAQISRNGQVTEAGQSPKPFPLGSGGQTAPNPDTLLDIWSTNRRIRLSGVLAGARLPEQPPEQPPVEDHSDVTAPSSWIGLIPLTGVPQLMYTPIRPYRPGSEFYGPASGFVPYAAPYRPLGVRPAVPHFGGGGPHLPGPVIGH